MAPGADGNLVLVFRLALRLSREHEESDDETGRSSTAVGLNGDRLHINRVRADYHDEIQRLDDLVNESFEYATRALSYLDQIQRISR